VTWPAAYRIADDVARTIALWRATGLTAGEAWRALTGRWVLTVSWPTVEAAMIRIALGRQAGSPVVSKRRLAAKVPLSPLPPLHFTDDPVAARDHGSPGRPSRPPPLGW